MRVVRAAEMRALEQAAVDAGASWEGLMEQAGWGVAQQALQRGVVAGQQALVLVGPGNNGGDGLVVARHLHDAGLRVQLFLWRRQEPANDANWQRCRRRGLAELYASDDPSGAVLRAALHAADLVVDALLGAGVSRPVAGELVQIIAAVNEIAHTRSRPLVLAIDLPTGVDTDTGAVATSAIHADLTVATGLLKRGLLLFPGRAHAGALALAPIDIPSHDLEAIMSETLTAEYVRKLLPTRPGDAHKGTFGKVMVVAGSLHYPGAATLACAGAGRVGAGLVTLATGRTVLGVAGRMPEATLLPLPEADWGALGPNATEELGKHLEGYAALLIGPGLGQADATQEFIRRVFGLDQPKARSRVGFMVGGVTTLTPEGAPLTLPPTVLDADGLNLLATIEDWPEHLPQGRFVFTPHPGELKRLLKLDELPGDAPEAAAEAAKRWGQVVVLKGATTVVAGPDGRMLIHDGANPALATAGTGDVLAGAIAGLIAQGLQPFDAAAVGVYLHAAAGLRVREAMGDAGTLASDLLPELPRAIKALRG